MKLESLFNIILCCFLLSSCKKEFIGYEHFDDIITKYQETKDYGLATGYKSFYLYYGEMHLPGRNFLAGEASDMKHEFKYPIVELLYKFPELKNERSIKAAAAQLLILRRKNPTFFDTIQLGRLVHRG